MTVAYRFIVMHLDRLEINKAKQHFQSLKKELSAEEKTMYLSQLENALNEAFFKLKELLEKGLWSEADVVFRDCGLLRTNQLAELRKLNYLNENNQPLTKEEREEFVYRNKKAQDTVEQVKSLLDACEFSQADQLYLDNLEFVEVGKFEQLKADYLKKFFSKFNVDFASDDEKALALAKISQNVQLKARAGSGKTTALALKTAILIERYGVNPNNILILAFNRQAKEEILDRISVDYKYKEFKNARTFHSLACKIVQPEKHSFELLVDEDNNKRQQLFLANCIRDLESDTFEFKETLYEFFRAAANQFDNLATYQSAEGYQQQRNHLYSEQANEVDAGAILRSRRYPTLLGNLVRSQPEKYIADFLFEHDISYSYEQYFLPKGKGRGYHPDFTFKVAEKKYVLEHWGVDEFDPKPTPWRNKTFEEYVEEMRWKREYWRDVKPEYTLIETSPRDILYDEKNIKKRRKNFEDKLKARLEENGVTCKKLPFDELYRKLVISKGKYKIRLLDMFLSFIKKAKQLGWTADDARKKIEDYHSTEEREAAFLWVAQHVYSRYESQMIAEGQIDFDDLLLKAKVVVDERRGDCMIGEENQGGNLKELEWLLIDEFQDFSKAFYQLVESVRNVNPDLKIVAVGDDWQAINGFAGSDLKYFYKFADNYPPSDIALLSTNFRSQRKIVELGNRFMEGLGAPSRALPSKPAGKFIVRNIEDGDAWILKGEEKKFSFNTDNSGSGPTKDARIDFSTEAKYLKLCFNIAREHFKTKPDTTLDILSRTGRVGSGVTLAEFRDKLLENLLSEVKKGLQVDFDKIRVETVHKMKGKEADVVIILEVTENKFPLLHPDNELYRLFGRSLADAYEEEKRLFYVAITRARENLYFLTERGRESIFLKKLT